MKTKTFLGLPKLTDKIPHYTGLLFNWGGITIFSMIPAILILWLGFDQFQNPNNPTTFLVYLLAASVGLVVQHIVRYLTNFNVQKFYSHWLNGVFMILLFIIGYLTAAEKFGL